MKRFMSIMIITGLMVSLAAMVPANAQQMNPKQQQQGQKMSEEEMQKMMEQMQRQQQRPQPQMIESGTYTDDDFHFTVEIPEGWEASKMRGIVMVHKGTIEELQAGKREGSFIVFTRPEAELDPLFQGQDINDIPMGEFRKDVEAEIANQQGANAELVTVEKTEMIGKPAFHVVQKMTMMDPQTGQPSQMMGEMYIFMHKGNQVSIFYTSPMENWKGYQGFISKHIKTMKFL